MKFQILLNEFKNISNKYEDKSDLTIFFRNLCNIQNEEFSEIDHSNIRKFLDVEKDVLKKHQEQKTLIIYNQTCEKHGIIPESYKNRIQRRMALVENTDRLSVLLQPPFGVFLSDFILKNCEFKNNSPSASLADISKVHDYEYISNIRQICLDMKFKNNNSIEKYDSDTYICQSTFDASLQAAGCVMDAIDQVLSGEHSNAFVAIRPPGHHAGYFGKVE